MTGQGDGFSADIETLNQIAEKTLPAVAGEFERSALAISGLKNNWGTVFGQKGENGMLMGEKYNELVEQLSLVGLVIGNSVSVTGARLKLVADAYEKTDRKIAGK